MKKKIIIDFDSFLFKNIFNEIGRQMHYPKKEATVLVLNKERSEKLNKTIRDKYKFIFDYPNNNDEVVGTEVLYLGVEEI